MNGRILLAMILAVGLSSTALHSIGDESPPAGAAQTASVIVALQTSAAKPLLSGNIAHQQNAVGNVPSAEHNAPWYPPQNIAKQLKRGDVFY